MSQLHAMNQILRKHCTTQPNCLGHTLHIIQARPKARTNSFDQSFVSGRALLLFFFSSPFIITSGHTPFFPLAVQSLQILFSLFIYLSSIFLSIYPLLKFAFFPVIRSNYKRYIPDAAEETTAFARYKNSRISLSRVGREYNKKKILKEKSLPLFSSSSNRPPRS